MLRGLGHLCGSESVHGRLGAALFPGACERVCIIMFYSIIIDSMKIIHNDVIML